MVIESANSTTAPSSPGPSRLSSLDPNGRFGTVAAYEFLSQLRFRRRNVWNAIAEGHQPAAWLIPLRKDIRRLWRGENAAIIRRRIHQDDGELLAVYVWLLSRFADRCRLFGIDDYIHDASPSVRKHVAKALRRLQAWQHLEVMAAENPADAAINWYAKTPYLKRQFSERLRNYSVNVDQSRAAEAARQSQMPYWSLYTPWQGKPSKSLELIRDILLRIHHWVHGQ